jgi:glycosyltransferase involved in cell wall biosynthesis
MKCMLPIVCNTRCLNADLTGVQRYTQKILSAFPGEIQRLAPLATNSRGIKGHVWEQLVLPAKTIGKLLWSPSNTGPLFCQRQVVTVHDLVTLDHPEWFNRRFVSWYNTLLPQLCKKADHILTISEFSRSRILDLFSLPPSRVTMIHNGVDHSFSELSLTDYPIELPFKRYVLSLGSLEPRKNIPLLLSAWKNILNYIPEDIGLVIVGGKGNYRIFRDAGIPADYERVYFTGHISDSYITRLFHHAILFVYLSLYEGFGLPPLEAMSAGIPVLTGELTSLPEVVGEGGWMIDPYSTAECEVALVRLITDEKLRSHLSARALLQASKFTWAETAAKTWRVLQAFT